MKEDTIYSMYVYPRFKEVCFTNARAKRLLLSIMRAITRGDSVTSSASVVNDDQEDVPIKKKKSLLDSFDELKKIYQITKTKIRKNYPYTAVLNTSTERGNHYDGGRETRAAFRDCKGVPGNTSHV